MTAPVRLRFRVRFAETDAQGVVYYGSYFTYFEMGRVELLRQVGVSFTGKDGALYVARASCDYLAPARFDDELELRTAPLRVGRSSFGLRHVIERPADGVRIAVGEDVVVHAGPDGRPAPLPSHLRDFLCACHDPAWPGDGPPARPLAGAAVAAVGSRNPAKVEAARAVLGRVAPWVEVRAVEVPSGVPAQPMGEEQTLAGARARALAAREAAQADLGVGMEAGVTLTPAGLLVGGWCAVVDRRGHWGLARTAAAVLPDAVARRVLAGEELGRVIDDLSGVAGSSGRFGALGYLSRGLYGRREGWEAALTEALAPWLRPELYAAAGSAEEGSPLPLRETSRGS